MSRLPNRLLSASSTCIWFILICVVVAQGQSNSGSQDSAAMSERVQQLEKQLQELRSEIAALKPTSAITPATTAEATAPAAVPQSNLVASSPAADSAHS